MPFVTFQAPRNEREVAALEEAMVAAGVRLVDADTGDDDEFDRRSSAFRAAAEAWMRAQGWRAPRRSATPATPPRVL
jgi:hypothetical protein